MKKIFNLEVFLSCIVLCLTGCGSSNQGSSTISDSKPAEEEEVISESSAEEEETTNDDSAEAEENNAESETIQNDNQDISVAEVVTAYADYLKENNENFDTFGAVGLIHLDDDEIPELAVSIGTSHASGICFYSYDGTNVVDLGSYGSLGCACYEYRKGIMYGYYTGMGSTFDHVAIENDGKIENEYRVVITNIEWADPSATEGGYRFAITDEEFNATEISQEEYEKIINPYLIENRDYTMLNNDDLIRLHEIGDIEEALLKSLDSESNYPKVPVDYADANTDYFSSRVTPTD